jgi:integrase
MSRRGVMKPLKGKVKERPTQVFRPALNRLNLWASQQGHSGGLIVGELTHDQLRTRWDALRAETGLRCEFHQLRTFCATWLLEQGIDPIDVAVQLHGHTNPTVVMKYYAMIRQRQGARAAAQGGRR